ncbi:MAG TPA: hypothetical protein VG273_20645 [Bryobacteraceae bacterium]|nr:hypothetical protein [Bryobacteraceae bacterium]
MLGLTRLSATAPDAKINSGRRRRTRYELQKELRFSYRQGSSLFFGSGRTKDMGDEGIRFESDHVLPRNSEIELRISWPLRLQDVCSLELVVRGPIVRSDSNGCVIRVKSCEFQTCGDRSFDPDCSGESACSVLA